MAKQNSGKSTARGKQATTFKDKLQTSWNQVGFEGRKILNTLGADLVNEDKSLSAVMSRIRDKNPSLKKFVINLDSATYDVRVKINWDAHMLSAYAWWQLDKALTDVVRPKIDTYRTTVEAKTNELVEKAHGLTDRFSH